MQATLQIWQSHVKKQLHSSCQVPDGTLEHDELWDNADLEQ